MQLASLMPTPSSSLVLQLNPPALLLENVSFQSIFGETLQKELDHYLTYVASLVARLFASVGLAVSC